MPIVVVCSRCGFVFARLNYVPDRSPIAKAAGVHERCPRCLSPMAAKPRKWAVRVLK